MSEPEINDPFDAALDQACATLERTLGVHPEAARVMLVQRAIAALHGLAPGSAGGLIGAIVSGIEVCEDDAAEAQSAQQFEIRLETFLSECVDRASAAGNV